MKLEHVELAIKRMENFLGKSIDKLPKEAAEDLLVLISTAKEYAQEKKN